MLLLGACMASPRPVPLPAAAPEEAAGQAAAPDDPQEAWRTRVGNGLEYGITVSGPVILASTTNRMLVAYAAEDGERFWGRRYGSPLVGTPLRVGEHIHFGTGYRDRKVHALGLERGGAAWERRAGEVRTGVAVHGASLFVGMEDGRVLALALADGTVHWERHLPGKPAWTPIVHDERVLAGTLRDTLYALERGTGAVMARLPLPGTPSAPPILVGDTLYLPLHPGALAALALGGKEPLLAWHVPVGDHPVLAAPVPGRAGTLLLLDRAARLWSVDAAGGVRRLVELGGAAIGSLAAAAQGVVVGRLDGALFLIDHDGAVLWRRELGDAIVSPVVVRRDGLYVPLLHGQVVKLR
jgi:outer membrane protein assembly factor BamB